ncbi:VanZ family protein [Ureibacillus sp. MALMAid1270]|uniref:VanZ family protein n=1 Tax=Ureibacillus sp. MALMAid1270 TaxID=3411629 RepID=UPI003BA58FDE
MDYIIDFILLALIYYFLYKKWSKESIGSLIIKSLMYVYLVMVLYVTLMPFTIPFSGNNNLFLETANAIPFRDVMLKYDGAIREVFLNILMMVPLGFLYPIIKKKGVIRTLITTFLFSLFIECSQLLGVWWGSTGVRIFDVTDLITNTIGGLVGFLMYCLIKPVVFKIYKGIQSGNISN